MNESSTRPPRTKKNRKLTFWRILSVLLVLIIGLMAIAAILPATRWAHGEGYVITDREIEVHASVEGAIELGSVPTGSMVLPGDILIQLNDAVQQASLEESRSQADAQLAALESLRKQQELAEAQRKEQILQAQMTLQLAKSQLEQMNGQAGFSKKEVEEADLRMRLATSRLTELSLPHDDIDRLAIEVLKQRIAASHNEINRLMAEVEQRKVRAPIAGTIHFHRFEPGEIVKPEHVLGQIFDRSTWIVRIQITERRLPDVKLDQEAEVYLSAYHRFGNAPLTARVNKIDPVVSPLATGDGIFSVELTINPPDGLVLQPGMTAWADINTGSTTWLWRLLGE